MAGTENWYPLQVRNGEYKVNHEDQYVAEITRKHGPVVMNHVVEKFRDKDSANASRTSRAMQGIKRQWWICLEQPYSGGPIARSDLDAHVRKGQKKKR